MKDDEILTPVMGDGKFASSLPLFGGLSIWEANPKIVKTIEEKGALLAVDWKHVHSYMHCWRHKTPVILRATTQWFAVDGQEGPDRRRSAARDGAARHRADAVLPGLGPGAPARHDRQPAGLDAVAPAPVGRADAVLPAQGDRRAASAHAGAARSRSRKRVETGRHRGLAEHHREELLGADAANTRKARTRSTSGSTRGRTHFTVLRGSHAEQSTFPADLYLEGSDQHRGWFHSSLLTACMLDGRAAVQRACSRTASSSTCEGRKMSKSLGNTHGAAEDLGHARRRDPAPVGGERPTTPAS